MRRVGVLAAAVVLLLTTSAAADHPRTASVLRVTGSGGQQAVLTVPASGMRLGYPFFSTPRLAGPDGTVGGVLIQRLPSRELVGGLLLQNVPGFDGAVEMGILGFDGVRLPQGRYALTLLGSGRQSVTLEVAGSRSRALTARGAARPVTRTAFGSASAVHTWAEPVELPAQASLTILGSGAGGDNQQAGADATCFRPAAADDGLCLSPDSSSSMASPGAGAASFWSTHVFGPAAAEPGDYTYSGRVAAVGTGSLAAHSTVLITLPR